MHRNNCLVIHKLKEANKYHVKLHIVICYNAVEKMLEKKTVQKHNQLFQHNLEPCELYVLVDLNGAAISDSQFS